MAIFNGHVGFLFFETVFPQTVLWRESQQKGEEFKMEERREEKISWKSKSRSSREKSQDDSEKVKNPLSVHERWYILTSIIVAKSKIG